MTIVGLTIEGYRPDLADELAARIARDAVLAAADQINACKNFDTYSGCGNCPERTDCPKFGAMALACNSLFRATNAGFRAPATVDPTDLPQAGESCR